MTKKRNLTTFMIAIMIMLFSLPVNAQGTVGYVVWDGANTLTFKGGESVPTTGAYKLYELNTDDNMPGWISDVASSVASSCKKVVFDASFNNVRPTSCYFWFQGFSNLSTIEGIRYLNTDNVKTMQAMFDGCSGLPTLDVSKFNTAKVTEMDFMFKDCSKLTSLNLSNFNTANVEYMYQMFNGCSGLTSLDLSSFNTDKVGSMYYMFNGCSGLTSLDLSSFNTAKVTNMECMFGSCYTLKSLDLSSFNTAKVGYMDNMFYGCSGLTKIYVSDDFATGNVTYGSNMFTGCSKLVGATSYDSNNTGIEMAKYTSGYFTKSNLTPYVKWNRNTNVLTFKVAHYIEGTAGEWKFNQGAKDPGWSIDEVKNNCTKVVFTPSFNHAKPTSCYNWFDSFSNLTTIQGIENLNTDEVTDMSYMFCNCEGLTSLTLSSFNTDKVENMSYMFYNCQSLESLILSSFNTANVTDMSSMFRDCSSLTSLELSSFNTANVTDMGYMFYKCSGLTSLDLSNFDTSNVTDMRSMFSSCSGLSSLDLSNFDTSNVKNMSYMFSGCSGLESLNLSSFNTDKVKNMSYMFNGCSGLTSLDLSSFKTANVTYMSYMFYNCSRLTSLDLSNFNTSNVTNMSYMFKYCKKLKSLDLSSFNTANVEKMDNMFNGCSGLKTIYVSDDFTTSDGTSGSDMFKGCTNLVGAASYNSRKTGKSMANCTSGYFTKSNLTPYVKWDADTKVLIFKVAHYIEGTAGEWKFNEGAKDPGWSIDEVKNNCTKVVFTPSFIHARPTSCYKWFSGFGQQLTTIQGIENLNTEEVTNMFEMFNSCSGLTFLDLSSFNTANVIDMNYMFNSCSGLTTIYVSDDFKIGNGTNGDNMFDDCSQLVGAAKYSPQNKTDKSMANYTSGYFKTYFTLGENKVELCGNPLTTKSLNLSGDYDFTPKYGFKANEATYSRDLSTSGSTWFSLCLPFAYTPDNFTAYKLMSASADAVEIEEMTGEIAAGTPVLFKFKDVVNNEEKKINISANKADIVKAPVDGTAVNGTDGSSLQLCGTYQTKTFSKDADGNAFILLNDKLMNPARMLTTPGVTSVSVKPFRAYMTLTASAQTSSARAFSIGHGSEEGTTAIDLLNSVATDDAEYYDINGRRIDAPAKGVNIVRRGNKTMKLIIK